MNRQWAEEAAVKLRKGQTVRLQPIGDSMEGRINNGDWVTLSPCDVNAINAGDIVLARISLRRTSLLVLHLVLEKCDRRLLIGNNHGRVDGWIDAEDVYGKVV